MKLGLVYCGLRRSRVRSEESTDWRVLESGVPDLLNDYTVTVAVLEPAIACVERPQRPTSY